MLDMNQLDVNKEILEEFEKNALSIPGKAGELAKEIIKGTKTDYYAYGSFEVYLNAVYEIYAEICGYKPIDCDKFEDLYNHHIEGILTKIVGTEKAKIIREICLIIVQSPYTRGHFRPSYRSKHIGTYALQIFGAIRQAIIFFSYDISIKETINKYFTGIEYYIAYSLRSNPSELDEIVTEAVLGESEVELSINIIRGIIISGVQKHVENLGKLFLAAKGQEGVRQFIVENADAGSAETHKYFINLILENKLERFSSVIRGFGTWTGLAFDNVKPALARKSMELAYQYMDENSLASKDRFESPDTIELYMALWAKAVYDISHVFDDVKNLLDSQDKYKRLVGWYFAAGTFKPQQKHSLAIDRLQKLLLNMDKEELAWASACLYQNTRMPYSTYVYGIQDQANVIKPFPDNTFSEDKSIRLSQIDILCDALKFIGNKKTKFNESIFPWASVELESRNVSSALLGLVGYDLDEDVVQKVFPLVSLMDTSSRGNFYVNHLDPKIPSQRNLLLQGLSDKGTYNKEAVLRQLGSAPLDSNDIGFLKNLLTTQAAGLRKSIMTTLEKQDKALIIPMIESLVNSSNDRQKAAGKELQDVFNLSVPSSEAVAQEYNLENGFGLYDPNHQDFDKDFCKSNRPVVKQFTREELAELLTPVEDDWKRVVEAIREVIVANAGKEVETIDWDGRKYKVLIGDNTYNLPLLPNKNPRIDKRITDFYLGEEILQAYDSLKISSTFLAVVLCFGSYHYGPWKTEYSEDTETIFKGLPFDKAVLDFDKLGKPYTTLIQSAMGHILFERNIGVFQFAFNIWKNLVDLIPESSYLSNYYYFSKTENDPNGFIYNNSNKWMINAGIIENWRSLVLNNAKSDEEFATYWKEAWYQYIATDKKLLICHGESGLQLLRACKLGLVSTDALYYEFFIGKNAPHYIRYATMDEKFKRRIENNKSIAEVYPFYADMLHKRINRIIVIEKNRGELPTAVSAVANNIYWYKGGSLQFIDLLSALGKDNFYRGYSWNDAGYTKNSTLSKLLRNCYPLDADTPAVFEAAVKAKKISNKRLMEAIMYAPQWSDFAEEITGITGLSSAVWLFHAHVNEEFSAEKETKIALYSTIIQQEFIDGTFDKDWFLQAYEAVGSDVFKELYKSAKYITQAANNAHRRSQLYADAVLGLLDKNEVKTTVEGKRNQNLLQAYGLIPLDEKNKSDALERYEFIHKYLKQSKQFGSQRRASESKSVMIALQNLAMTTGYFDVDRMSWSFESEKMESLRSYMVPYEIDDCDVNLVINEDGTPSIQVKKAGKVLKSVPAAIKKHERVIEIQSAVKELKEQKSRARQGFESAMVSQTKFTWGEIKKLLNHPVLKTMIESLVFVSGDQIGFPLNLNLQESDTVHIAHPVDFMEMKNRSSYQKELYEKEIIQPFKQVFREYYPITADELAEVNVSRRYAGHQVQPSRTVALLKTRGWTVDYEEGLQKVFHKNNLIVKLYSPANWFTPAEIEAPTLEIIRFYTRDKWEPVDFTKIPPIIFSEVMRDIDLVVSVAHVGGVDPEASHSTIEMRVAIAKELLTLLAINNVTFQNDKTSHAQIKGSKGEYSVHMGSGMVHQKGAGLIAVTPVHSQARGRIFLPFADDDPRTAEIMSKILLFAEDKKIKDPSILAQIG